MHNKRQNFFFFSQVSKLLCFIRNKILLGHFQCLQRSVSLETLTLKFNRKSSRKIKQHEQCFKKEPAINLQEAGLNYPCDDWKTAFMLLCINQESHTGTRTQLAMETALRSPNMPIKYTCCWNPSVITRNCYSACGQPHSFIESK